MRLPLLALLASRALLEGVTVTCAAVTLHAVLGGRPPLPLGDVALLVCGASLVLVAILRETRGERGNLALTAVALGGAALLGLVAAPPHAEAVERLGRLVLFGLLGEALLWRTLTVARGIARWSDTRAAVGLAATAVVIASLVPGTDATALPPFVLLATAAAGVALSLSRSAEELELAGTRARGGTSAGTATGAAFALGALALAAAAFAPSLRALAAEVTDVVGPVVGTIAYYLVLPFAYLAAFLVVLLEPLVRRIQDALAAAPVRELADRADQEEAMREAVEATRPLVLGALELVVGIVALCIAVLLVDRLTRERRSTLPAGATMEREPTHGLGIAPTLRALFPRRGPRRRAPRNDGTAAARVRVMYWRFLELAERAGVGWRAVAETPAEHHTRIASLDARWLAAEPIVRAFELVRYAEDDPDPALVARARAALEGLRSR